MTILIDNFSIGIEDWATVTGSFYFAVDVVDYDSPIDTSGTYFVHNGQVVPTDYSSIAGGYRCYYYPLSVVSSGTIDLIMHAENVSYGVLAQSFHLLYGYHCSFDELIDWGPNATVITTVEASNTVVCPNTESAVFYFETRDFESINLGASIQAIESVDLNAQIFPQSTAFFYGQTYTVTISGVKDFSGNEMAPYVFSFIIEDL